MQLMTCRAAICQGTGNSQYPTPVKVVADDTDPNDAPTDEGRAMLQIVHDLAPAATLAFSTCGTSSAEFASNIGNLYSQSGCQVMCDDIGFPDEPMFSDGPIAQAIDQVHSSGVTYFSAAGNDGNSGYTATFTPVTKAIGKNRAAVGGIQLSTIPPGEMNYIAEWHSFGTNGNGKPIVVQNIHTTDNTQLIFQWDDPFDVLLNNNTMNGVTTDYDILVFNAAGQFLASRSGLDVNTSSNPNNSTNEPLEIPPRNLAAKTSYKICIVRMAAGNGSGTHPGHPFALPRECLRPDHRRLHHHQ
ncbi:MAG: S8 family serine peptidase [Chthoniobacteraceae bacterium]